MGLGCRRPPSGWWCSRVPGHAGPCAARATTDEHVWVSDPRHTPGTQPPGMPAHQCCGACGVSRAYRRVYYPDAPDADCPGRAPALWPWVVLVAAGILLVRHCGGV